MKHVVILSGGMDSAVLLHHLLAEEHEVAALSFDYGQRHRVELKHADLVAAQAGVTISRVDLSGLRELLPGSSQTDRAVDVPRGHYAADSMRLTVVPNRNMIMLSVAIGHAVAIGAGAVAFGAHGGDHAIYPDCRPEFVELLGLAAASANYSHVQVLAPFIDLDKTSICALGSELGVPFEITWTCYDPQLPTAGAMESVHCGACGACTERREAFQLAAVDDPTRYAS